MTNEEKWEVIDTVEMVILNLSMKWSPTQIDIDNIDALNTIVKQLGKLWNLTI